MKWNQQQTTTADLFDEVTTNNFNPPVDIVAVVDTQITDEKMKVFGITERADAIVYTSVVLLKDKALVIDNRDRFRYEDRVYDIVSTMSKQDMGGHVLELKHACRLVE